MVEGDSSASTNPAKEEADARKAAAEADKAAVEASKAAQELTEWMSAEARAQREADRRKAIAEANKATAEADIARVQAFLPDLGSIERGEATVSGDKPIAPALAHAALGDAASQVARNIRAEIAIPDATQTGRDQPGRSLILLTTDLDLATSDGAYTQVKSSLDQLLAAADKLVPPPHKGEMDALAVAIPAIIASALPPILSLLSARRTISSHDVSIEDAAALAAVAGALPKGRVVIDDFRLVPEGDVIRRFGSLQDRRAGLIERKLSTELARTDAAARRAAHDERIKDLHTRLDEARKTKASTKKLDEQLEQARSERDDASREEQRGGVLVGLLDSTINAIDSFNAAATAPGAGSGRSLLVAASLREQLRQSLAGKGETRIARFEHVLFVKASSGSITQSIDDKPLWFDDSFTALGTVTIAYVLLDPGSSTVQAAGECFGVTSLTGKIGDEISITRAGG
jgi:hypothetical protein